MFPSRHEETRVGQENLEYISIIPNFVKKIKHNRENPTQKQGIVRFLNHKTSAKATSNVREINRGVFHKCEKLKSRKKPKKLLHF